MKSLFFATMPATSVLWVRITFILLGLASAVGRADVVLGNLGAASGPSININSTDLFAASFAMGGQAYSLTNLKTVLTFSPPDSTRFQLQSDSTGLSRPSGTVLSTFSNPTFISGERTYTFTPSSPFTLAPNTTYWLVGSTATSFDTAWVLSSPITNPTGSGANFGTYADSGDGGATWFNNDFQAPKFELNGTPAVGVPEPSSLLLVGAVACVATAIGLRRRRTSKPDMAAVTTRSGA